jgi:phage tail-like protein
MTQARDLLPLRLELMPTTSAAIAAQPTGRAIAPFQDHSPLQNNLVRATPKPPCQLVVHPGAPAELLVRIQNLSQSRLEIALDLDGDFPSHWCRIGIEGQEIPPQARREAVLYFQLPDNFFETDSPFPNDRCLSLDYRGHIYIRYSLDGDTWQVMAPETFNLFVRPDSVYLDFLPELYREVDFIGRVLSLFEQAFEPTVQTLDLLWAYLDPLTAPEGLLSFLASWVGWKLDPRLSIERQRHLIGQAIQLYSWRGTRRGLRLYLNLYTNLPLDEDRPEKEKRISIQEVFTQGFVLGETQLGEDAIVGGGKPYHFIVRLRPGPGDRLDEALVRQIIEQEKPAFCTYELYIEPSSDRATPDAHPW